jgi:hypothetical protein
VIVVFVAGFFVFFVAGLAVAFGLGLGLALGFGVALGPAGCGCVFPVVAFTPACAAPAACVMLGKAVPSMAITAAKPMTLFMMPPGQNRADPV